MLKRYSVPALQSAFDILDGFNDSFFGSDSFCYGLMTDVKENSDSYTIRAEVPGISRENIDIQYRDGLLAITADWSKEAKEGGVLRRRLYRFSEYLSDINPDSIEAILKDGVLTLNVPKREEVKSKQIEIKVE